MNPDIRPDVPALPANAGEAPETTALPVLRVELFDASNLAITIRTDVTGEGTPEYLRVLDLVRDFPMKRWSKDQECWRVPTTVDNVRHLIAKFREDEYEVTSEAEPFIRYQVLTEQVALRRQIRRWEYIFDKTVPAYEWKANKGRRPYNHQIVAADSANGAEMFAFLMEQGTGKTFCSIEEWVAEVYRRREQGDTRSVKVLVVCPVSLTNTWLREIEASVPVDVKTWSIRLDRHAKAVEQLVEGVRAEAELKVWVINYDRVGNLLEALIKMRFDFGVADEATMIKNPASNRSKAMLALRDSIRRRRILTGTIMANSILDVWCPFEFLGEACLGYPTYASYKRAYLRVSKDGPTEKVIGYANLNDLKERMARHSFIVKKAQCLDLPEKTYQTIRVPMGPRQLEIYDAMAMYMYLSLTENDGNGERDGEEVDAKGAAAALVRLAQITSGFVRTVEGDVVRIDDGDVKLSAVIDLINNSSGKVLVWARFQEDIRHLRDSLREAGIKCVTIYGQQKNSERESAADTFNADNDVKVLIGEPGTGGIGLTLLGPTGDNRCRTTIYYSMDYNLLKRLQSEDRNHRIGQDHGVAVYDVACEDTVDEAILERVMGKRELGEELTNMESIKDLLLRGSRKRTETAKSRGDIRSILKAQGIVIPVDSASQPGCDDFDHTKKNPRCEFCTGDPMTVGEEALRAYLFKSGEQR